MAKHKDDTPDVETKAVPKAPAADPPVPPDAGPGSAVGEPRVKMGPGETYVWDPPWQPGTPPVPGTMAAAAPAHQGGDPNAGKLHRRGPRSS